MNRLTSAAFFTIVVTLANSAGAQGTISSPLRALTSNPNYFSDAAGTPVYLAGSHTWNTLQDWGTGGSIQPLDFGAYVNMLLRHRHNFTLLWRTELPKFCGMPTTGRSSLDFSVNMQPWQRTGPGIASDGGLKFDLNKFDEDFFDWVRSRVLQLNASGIYAGIYLFTGEWLLSFRCSNDGYPFTGPNNVNGVDDGGGLESITMNAPNVITAIQDAYVEKMIDVLNDLPNVLWIVSEEAPASSMWWNKHLIAHVRSYESKKPVQHPIGYAAHSMDQRGFTRRLMDTLRRGNNTGLWSSVSDATIYNSNADWVAPSTRISPIRSCGSGAPSCKVNVNDSDHSYFGMWNETAEQNRAFVWKNFLNGNHVLFMDPYEIYYPNENRNICLLPVHGVCSAPDARWDNVRDNIGYTRNYASRVNLAAMRPQPNLFSSGYGLANTGGSNPEYLSYVSSGSTLTIDLTATPVKLSIEWFNPSIGVVVPGGTIVGGASRTLIAPFSSDAVLYLQNAPSNVSPTAPGRLQ
jgi:hypothetical protein